MPSPASDFVELYRAEGLPQAHALCLRLESDDIVTRIENETLQAAVGGLPFGWNTAPRVMVLRADEPAARAILAEFVEQANAIRQQRAETSDQDNGADDETDDRVQPISAVQSLLPKSTIRWEIAAVLAMTLVPSWMNDFYRLYVTGTQAPYWLDSLWYLVNNSCTLLAILYLLSRSGDPWSRFGIDSPCLADVFLALGIFVIHELLWRSTPVLATDSEIKAINAAIPRASNATEYLWMTAKFLSWACWEELIFRGYLIPRLRYLWNSRTWAVIVSALVYTSLQSAQGGSALLTGLLVGLAYGVCFLALGRIWPLVLGHALFYIRLELLAV